MKHNFYEQNINNKKISSFDTAHLMRFTKNSKSKSKVQKN